MGHIIVRLPDDLHDDFKAVTSYRHESMQAQIQGWIESHVSKHQAVIAPKWRPAKAK